MLTVSEAERDLLDAVAAGAVGYLVKATPVDELRRELHKTAQGVNRCFPQSGRVGARRVPSHAQKVRAATRPSRSGEHEVLQYVARGHTYREIGEQLFIADKTVENHVRNILGKLHLNRKQELIRYALDHGIE